MCRSMIARRPGTCSGGGRMAAAYSVEQAVEFRQEACLAEFQQLWSSAHPG